MGQPVMQWQILARNPDKVTSFYSALFGWHADDINAMGYRAIDTASDRGIKGGVWPIGNEGHPMVQLFVEVPDVPATVANVERLGGKIVIPPQVLPDGDEMAVVLDTEGLSIGLMKARGAGR